MKLGISLQCDQDRFPLRNSKVKLLFCDRLKLNIRFLFYVLHSKPIVIPEKPKDDISNMSIYRTVIFITRYKTRQFIKKKKKGDIEEEATVS